MTRTPDRPARRAGAPFAALCSLLLAVAAAGPARALEAVDWTSGTAGSAAGIDVTMTGLNAPTLLNQNLTGLEFSAWPLGATQECVDYGVLSDWSLALSEPVAAIYLYARYWRGPNAGSSPVQYVFDAPFSVLSGITEGSQTDEVTLSLPPPNYDHGVLVFRGPIDALAVATDATLTNRTDVTFGLVPMPDPATVVDWDETAVAGVAGDVAVSIAGLNAPALVNLDLSTADYALAPLAADQEVVDYSTGDDWTLTLSRPVDGLLLYTKFWRGIAAGTDPDPATYTFDAPFAVVAGLDGASVGNGGTTLSLPETQYFDGILLFEGPLETLTMTSSSSTAARQELTVAVVNAPEPAGAGAAALAALASVAKRRRTARA